MDGSLRFMLCMSIWIHYYADIDASLLSKTPFFEPVLSLLVFILSLFPFLFDSFSLYMFSWVVLSGWKWNVIFWSCYRVLFDGVEHIVTHIFYSPAHLSFFRGRDRIS